MKYGRTTLLLQATGAATPSRREFIQSDTCSIVVTGSQIQHYLNLEGAITMLRRNIKFLKNAIAYIIYIVIRFYVVEEVFA